MNNIKTLWTKGRLYAFHEVESHSRTILYCSGPCFVEFPKIHFILDTIEHELYICAESEGDFYTLLLSNVCSTCVCLGHEIHSAMDFLFTGKNIPALFEFAINSFWQTSFDGVAYLSESQIISFGESLRKKKIELGEKIDNWLMDILKEKANLYLHSQKSVSQTGNY